MHGIQSHLNPLQLRPRVVSSFDDSSEIHARVQNWDPARTRVTRGGVTCSQDNETLSQLGQI